MIREMTMGKELEKIEEYKELTKNQNWEGICQVNNVSFSSFGTKKELNVLSDFLEDDEVVLALTSGIMSKTSTTNNFDFGTNTWLIVLTNERFLFLDCAMLTKSVDSQSVRLENVQAVSTSQGWVLGKIQIDLGARVIVMDNCPKATLPILSELANKCLRIKKQKQISNNTNGEESELLKEQVRNQLKIIELLEKINTKLN